MKARRLACLALLPLPLAALNAVASSTFRCDSRLVSLDAPTAEVLAKCGEPSSREYLGYKEVPYGFGLWQEVPVEEWIYGPRHGMYHFLRFEGNRLRGIDSRRGN